MRKFMCDHPITTFLIVDTLITGIVNIVKIVTGGNRKDDSDIIETTFVED